MNKVFSFFTSHKIFSFFLLLEAIAIIKIVNSHNYAQHKTNSWLTAVSGYINNQLSVIETQIKLKKHNQQLLEQNTRLLNQVIDSIDYDIYSFLPNQFQFIPGYVISSQYQFSHNTILINKGEKDGIEPDMGVIATNGIVGIVQKTSKNFSKIISILNTSTKMNVALKNTNYTGFLSWKGKKPNIFLVTDMPGNVPIKIGDTIVTSGVSNVFPKGIQIGQVIDINKETGLKNYKLTIKSFTDFQNLGPVFFVKNKYKIEVDSLLKQL